MSVWLIEISFDRGQTWNLEQGYGIYKSADRALLRIRRQLQFYGRFDESSKYCHAMMRASEYKRSV